MKYIPIEVKTALTRLKRRIPYGWDLNIYRGCEHGCKYCYAIYSHDYLNNNHFFDQVYYKEGLIKALENELSSPEWHREIVNIGGVTDSYQPIEEKLKIMPEVLKLMIKYKTPVIISTKSDLILRDIDLINELSQLTYVNVAMTVTTMDEDLRKKLEPHACSSQRRFEVLSAFKKTNASLGVHLMPIIPYLTDNCENLDAIYKEAALVGVNYVLPGTMYLKGKTKLYFLEFIKDNNHFVYEKIIKLYQTGSAGKEYKDELYKKINSIKNKYGVTSNYTNVLKAKLNQKK